MKWIDIALFAGIVCALIAMRWIATVILWSLTCTSLTLLLGSMASLPS